mmetsp:Transcript_72946/g.235893  ORF Transcript_72946/g.235893 Transcript_72946/m.235893 type:complete len:337 (+) Transcript_72946:293-1303(+)
MPCANSEFIGQVDAQGSCDAEPCSRLTARQDLRELRSQHAVAARPDIGRAPQDLVTSPSRRCRHHILGLAEAEVRGQPWELDPRLPRQARARRQHLPRHGPKRLAHGIHEEVLQALGELVPRGGAAEGRGPRALLGGSLRAAPLLQERHPEQLLDDGAQLQKLRRVVQHRLREGGCRHFGRGRLGNAESTRGARPRARVALAGAAAHHLRELRARRLYGLARGLGRAQEQLLPPPTRGDRCEAPGALVVEQRLSQLGLRHLCTSLLLHAQGPSCRLDPWRQKRHRRRLRPLAMAGQALASGSLLVKGAEGRSFGGHVVLRLTLLVLPRAVRLREHC